MSSRSINIAAMLATMLLVACAAPSEEEADESGGQAIGERWRSPIAEGSHDSEEATVSVRNGLQGQ